MKRATKLLLVALMVMALVPSLLNACDRFTNYDVVRAGTRFDGVYPHGTFCLKQETARKLVRMLEATVRALDTVGVPYFLGAGSLLGWARHQQSIIPFDDDIDLYLFPIASKQLARLGTLLPSDMRLVFFEGWWKVISTTITFTDRLSISIDLFEVEDVRGRVQLKNPVALRKWPKETFPRAMVLPLQPATFCGVPVHVPHDPDAVLRMQYGDDCMEVGYINNVHGVAAYLASHLCVQKKPTKKIAMTAAQCVPLLEK
jgi:hypothetical protein